MPKPKPRSVWCPLVVDEAGTVCNTERTTAALPRTKLKCPGCAGYYRAPDNRPDTLDELPTAAVAAGARSSGNGADHDEGGGRDDDAQRWGRRGGRAASRIGRARG